MKSQLIHQKSNFDFLVNIKFQRSKFINTFKNINIDHQEVKKSKSQFEKSNFSRLRNFSKCFVHDKFITSWYFFTKMQDDSKETCNMKIVDLYEFYNFLLEG